MKFSLYLLCALLFVAAAHARSAPDVEGFEIQVFNNAFCRSELNSAPYGHYNYFWPNAADGFLTRNTSAIIPWKYQCSSTPGGWCDKSKDASRMCNSQTAPMKAIWNAEPYMTFAAYNFSAGVPVAVAFWTGLSKDTATKKSASGSTLTETQRCSLSPSATSITTGASFIYPKVSNLFPGLNYTKYGTNVFGFIAGSCNVLNPTDGTTLGNKLQAAGLTIPMSVYVYARNDDGN
mmetsp:Transcript_14465/g.24677  ORF Transcript_14465/g.24677 Transcript_14465/m.24677 type:complete len:234 (+) Transcript_14465:116-817(+)